MTPLPTVKMAKVGVSLVPIVVWTVGPSGEMHAAVSGFVWQMETLGAEDGPRAA